MSPAPNSESPRVNHTATSPLDSVVYLKRGPGTVAVYRFLNQLLSE